MNIKIPENWGQDPVSNFIESAYQNNIAAFANFQGVPLFNAIYEIDRLFSLTTNIEYGQDEMLLLNFIGRCHSAYLGAIKLSTSGQVVEAYMVIRGCLENALYALFINDAPAANEELSERSLVWINRGKDEKSTKKCRQMFTYRAAIDNLLNQDKILGQEALCLYNRAIDLGAHPNFPGHITTSVVSKDEVGVEFLLPGCNPACKLCVQTTVEVGICSLKIFGRIFGDRFHSAGITEKIEKIAMNK
jgi:hypothetical protein